MTPDNDLPILTEAELDANGVCVGLRIAGASGRWRCGDDLVTRSQTGCVTRCFGYFTESQQAMRRRWVQILTQNLREFRL